MSPHAWGGSFPSGAGRVYLLLVPTRVGMILDLLDMFVKIGACPHTRGDDPIITMSLDKY